MVSDRKKPACTLRAGPNNGSAPTGQGELRSAKSEGSGANVTSTKRGDGYPAEFSDRLLVGRGARASLLRRESFPLG